MIPGFAYAATIIGQVGLVATTSFEGLTTMTTLERAVALGAFAYALVWLVVLGTLTRPRSDRAPSHGGSDAAVVGESLKKAA
jgi:hypothetical protein